MALLHWNGDDVPLAVARVGGHVSGCAHVDDLQFLVVVTRGAERELAPLLVEGEVERLEETER